MDKFKITLPKIEKINEKEIKELEFREPLGADMEEFVGEMSVVGSNKAAIGKIITTLAEKLIVSEPLSADDFRKMKGKNYMAIVQELSNFLM